MPVHLGVTVLFLVLSTACSTSRLVRLDTGHGEPLLLVSRADEAERVELEEDEFTKAIAKEARQWRLLANPEMAAREMFDVPPRSGWYGYTKRQGVVPLREQIPAAQWAQVDEAVTQEYVRFCEAAGKPRDCLRLLLNSPVLNGDGRYALAMSFAMEEVLPEMMKAFKDMADPEAVKAAILWAMTIYAVMWLAPEPVFSKGLATVVTASFICYVGVDTFWTLIQGWRRLVDAADHATSFSELRAAGERYGKVMGQNAARAFALLLSAAIGQTASSLSAKIPTLPGSAQASVVGAAEVGVRLTAVAQVEAVAVSADVFTMALPPNAVASTAEGLRGAVAAPVEGEGQWHHIATDKWLDAAHSGGPWTPKFQKLFDRAGMSLNDSANRVRVMGHQGPHPEEYHREVFRRLRDAMKECRSMHQCREALTVELKKLAQELSTKGSYLNKLVTRSE
ncbi:AHH domain-containing protein [Hyalangium rubrum]|uniref:AHH domain-containing protein n=1 Tax=Hyalangium rubrum TaxID=3103134 RepID=A0ABU5H637_9BACT|nr:AHH domain-containing protein [Hyalangium sp. s54d21]MDY7228592.1 AHH domain-containing protein [Hyalangium sp. s54d21]